MLGFNLFTATRNSPSLLCCYGFMDTITKLVSPTPFSFWRYQECWITTITH